MKKWLLISLLFNVLVIMAVLAGGWLSARYAGSRYKKAYERRVTIFKATEPQPGAIIFLGNSITQSGNWNEWLTQFQVPVLNRGISGDITHKVLKRLNEVIRHQPSMLFISLGTNDLGKGYDIPSIIHDYSELLHRVQQASPHTHIYVQAVFPVRHRTPNGAKNEDILLLNRKLQELADRKACTYLDLHTPFLNHDGLLKSHYTNDDLHITGEGYRKWMEIITPLIVENLEK